MDNTIQINELKAPIGNGATNPILGLSNGKQYVIKTINNSEGNKVLVNEIIFYFLAKQLDLPIPKSGLCIINDKTQIDKNVYDLIDDFSDDCYGIGFYSEYIENSTILGSAKMIETTSNYETLIPRLMLFDHIIYNKDRNKGNLLFKMQKSDRKLIIIDHSHVFNLETLWDSIQLNKKIEEEDYKDEYIMQNNKYIYSKFKEVMNLDMSIMAKEVDYFKNNIDEKIIRLAVESVPKEWESDSKELEGLAKYIIYRFNHIEYYSNLIASYIYKN